MAQTNYKTKWDLSLISGKEYTKELLEKEKTKVKKETQKFINKWKDNEDYLRNPDTLKIALDEYEQWNKKYSVGGNFSYYYGLKSSLNLEDPKLKAIENDIDEFTAKLANEIQFFSIRLAKVSKEQQTIFLKSTKLKNYHQFLSDLFKVSQFILTEKEEKILNLVSAPASQNWSRMISEFLAKEEKEVLNRNGKEEVKNFSEILNLLSDKNKKVRDTAAEAFNKILDDHSDTATQELNSVLQYKKITDELRGYKKPEQSRLISENMDPKVVKALTTTVKENYDISKKFYKLKAKLFNLDQLEYHERTLEYGEIKKEYPFDKSVQLINETFKELDAEFSQIFLEMLKNGQIDVFPKKGKRSGAFCTGNRLENPSYVLLNHQDKLNDVKTIAHEMGHAINNVYMQRNINNSLYYDIYLCTAETASTFMEDFVLQKLMKDMNEEEKLTILVQKADDDIATIIRQIAFYEFELELHKLYRERKYLSKEEIGTLFNKHMSAYMGNGVKMTSGCQNWWIYVQHFRYMFYVYSYSFGALASKSMQNMVKKNPKDILKVKKFLSAGTTKDPKEIFDDLDIDILDKGFWEKGLLEVSNLVDNIEKLGKSLGKI